MKKELQVEKLQRLPLGGCRLIHPAIALTWRFILFISRAKQPYAVFLTRLLACSTVKPMTSSPS